MNKWLSIGTIVATALIIAGWYALSQSKTPGTAGPTTSSTETASTDYLSIVNLAPLEKDRLYTKEEGTYANLPLIGQELLQNALAPECAGALNSSGCDQWQWIVTESRIIAAKNGIFLFDVPTGKGSSYYVTYDATDKKLGKPLPYFGTQIKNGLFIVYINNLSDQREELLYYRPGMDAFAIIPDSSLSAAESYWYYAGMGTQLSKFSFSGNVLSIDLFNERGSADTPAPKADRTVTFDLSLIQ